jgi:CheY-like chemotaxis protein
MEDMKPIHLLLADDDRDDCDLFKDALEELALSADLSIVNDGEQLMALLKDASKTLPEVLFLDLNMPRKNGFECLSEIKSNSLLKDLPVIVFSTSSDRDIVNTLYTAGAHFYISKPNEFDKLKRVINSAISAIRQAGSVKPARENFVLQ